MDGLPLLVLLTQRVAPQVEEIEKEAKEGRLGWKRIAYE